MTIRELILQLLDFNYDKQVVIWDANQKKIGTIADIVPTSSDPDTILIPVDF